MILVVHADGASLGLPVPAEGYEWLTPRNVWRLGVESVSIIGVNCFTLISGYFGIRLRWRGVIAFLFQCLFYSVLLYLVGAAVYPHTFTWTGLLQSFMVLTHTDLWYVPAYFGLMLLSPLLNAGISALSKKEFSGTLAAFIIFNLWCGWGWGGKFNPTGYTILQLVMVYMIGRWLAICLTSRQTRRLRPLSLAAYLVSTVGIFISSVYLSSAMAFAYNSPLVMAASVSFFMLFASYDFHSKLTNYVAKSSFAVYLIHKNPVVWIHVYKPAMLSLWQAMTLGRFTLLVAAICLLTYLTAMAIDPLRRSLSNRLTGS